MTTAASIIIVSCDVVILWLLVDVLQHEFRIRRERKRFGKDIYINSLSYKVNVGLTHYSDLEPT